MSSWEAGGQSDEWYTPRYIFDALGVLFDLDVAAPVSGGPHVPAQSWYSTGSLELPWHGFVWMNPPYGGRNALYPWLKKFNDHGSGVALVPDRTSAPWFQTFAPRMDGVLFVGQKIKFERPDGTLGKMPGNGSALFARGRLGVQALDTATHACLGWRAK